MAQVPTFSLEASAINGKSLTEGPVGFLYVIPGDRITAEVYVRDWSIGEQRLSGYQADLDTASFASGPNGVVEPVGYQASLETELPDTESVYVNRKHDRYVYRGIQSLDVAGSLGKGYRLAAVVIGEEGPLSKQDGTKYYAGTVNLLVSDNAIGKFTIGFTKNPDKCMVVNQSIEPILPLQTISLVIVVCPRIVGADVAGRIDALAQNNVMILEDRLGDGLDNRELIRRGIAALNAAQLSRDSRAAQVNTKTPDDVATADSELAKTESS